MKFMLGKLLQCRHKKTSLPITRRRRDGDANRVANTYVVCLSCSQQIPYSFREGRVVPERRGTARPAG